jgi:hypothetical protein
VNQLLTPRELEAHIQVPLGTLEQWRYRGVGPPYLRLANGRIRYRVADVERWLDASAVAPNRRAPVADGPSDAARVARPPAFGSDRTGGAA